MKQILLFLSLLFLQACFTIKVYETPDSVQIKKPTQGHKIVRSGEQVDFGSHKAEIYYFRDDQGPKGVWYEDDKSNLSSLDTLSNKEGKKPLLLIEGQKMPRTFFVDALKPENIESVTVLKDSFAMAKYGKEAQHGVIEIVLKKKD